LAPTLILVMVMAEALLITRGSYAGAVALAVIALPVVVFALRRAWRERG
jgi:ABC-type phosphate transport system permease subunit